MFEKIKQILEFSSKNGWYLPSAYDQSSQGPNIALLYSHLTFCLTFVFCMLLGYDGKFLTAAVTSMIFWVVATVFFLIKRLKTFKADLDDKSIELDGGSLPK